MSPTAVFYAVTMTILVFAVVSELTVEGDTLPMAVLKVIAGAVWIAFTAVVGIIALVLLMRLFYG